MNRDQFFNRHQNNQIHEAELERKWRLFQEQQQQEQWLLEAAAAASGNASSVGGAGGGGTTTPQSLVKNGQNVSLLFTTEGVPTLQCITAVSNGKITIADLGVPSADYNIYSSSIINNGGTIWFGNFYDTTVNTSKIFMALIDGEGNHVMTDTFIDYETWDIQEFEGNILLWGYFLDDAGQGTTYQARWWDGFNINTAIFTNVDYTDFGIINGWDETADGTITIGVQTLDNVYSKYLLTSNGDQIRFDDKLTLADGRTPYSIRGDIGNNSILVQYYDGDKYDIIKILRTDGTVVTLDISGYDANNLNYWETGFGWVLKTFPDFNTTDTVIIFWDETLNTFEVYNAGPEQNWDDYEVRATAANGYNDYEDSPEAFNNATVVLYGFGTFDDKMVRYDSLVLLNKFAGVPFKEWTPNEIDPEYSSFGFASGNHCATPTFFCHTDGNALLQILTFTAEDWNIQDSPSAYEFVTDYFTIRAMGKYALLQWYDTGHDPEEEQAFMIMEGSTVIDTVWVSTANSWNTNYDTAYIAQNDENKTYYFTPAAEEWFNITPDYSNSWFSDDINPGADWSYVGSHNFGTTLLNLGGDNYAVLTRDTNGNLDTWAPSGNPEKYVSNKHDVVIDIVDVDGDNVYQILFVDTEGNVVNTVNTHNDTNYNYWVVSERVVFVQATGDGDFHVFSCTPTGYTEKTFTGSIHNNTVNDIRWRWW